MKPAIQCRIVSDGFVGGTMAAIVREQAGRAVLVVVVGRRAMVGRAGLINGLQPSFEAVVPEDVS